MTDLVKKPLEEVVKLLPARMRRKFARGHIEETKLKRFLNKLRKAKAEAPAGSRPAVVKTHYRNMVVLPEMVGSIIGVHNGKVFMPVEIKSQMIGHYLGEFSITYKPVKHGKYLSTIERVTNGKLDRADY